MGTRLLTSFHKDELYHLALMQQTCFTFEAQDCNRPCRFDASLQAHNVTGCVPSELEPVLVLAGKSCPYTSMMLRNAECRERTEEICTLSTREDKLPDCVFQNGKCRADHVSMEVELFDSTEIATAHAQCRDFDGDRTSCLLQCADSVLEANSEPQDAKGAAQALVAMWALFI